MSGERMSLRNNGERLTVSVVRKDFIEKGVIEVTNL